jgi:hypothetical protein
MIIIKSRTEGIKFERHMVFLDKFMMSAKYCIFGLLNLHLLNLQLCYFLMFSVSFGILVCCRSLRVNGGF